MNPNDVLIGASQLAMGFALAASCGLRAFLPLFTAAVLARMGYVVVGPSFAWIGSTPALIVFGSAVVIEFIGDKFPVVDHALDVAGLIVKPTAATLLTASMFTYVDPILAVVIGLAAGGAVASAVHVVKSKLRLASTLLTAGIGNPILSVLEDITSILSTALAVLLPLFAAFFVTGCLLLAVGLVLLRHRRSTISAVRHSPLA